MFKLDKNNYDYTFLSIIWCSICEKKQQQQKKKTRKQLALVHAI